MRCKLHHTSYASLSAALAVASPSRTTSTFPDPVVYYPLDTGRIRF